MIFSKKTTPANLLSLLLLLALSFSAYGQNLLRYVPADVPVVVTMNLGNLNKKVNLLQLQQYDFYGAFVKEMESSESTPEKQVYMRKLMEEPATLGFDMLQPMYFFVKELEDTTIYTLVMKMGNRSRYEGGLMELFPDTYSEGLIEKSGYQIWQDESATYAWNDEVILNIWTGYTPSFDDWSMEDGEFDWDEIEEEPAIVFEETEIEKLPEEPIEEEPVEEFEIISFDDLDIQEDRPIEPGKELDLSEEIFLEEPRLAEESDTIPPPPPPPPFEEEEDWGTLFGDWGADTKPTALNWANQVMAGNIGSNLAVTGDFKKSNASSSDVHLWMDYSFFMEQYKKTQSLGMGSMDSEMEMFMNMAEGFLETMYSDTYLSAGLNFEEGKVAIRSQLFFNDDMAGLYRGMKDVKFNKKFLRYVEGGDQMFGYAYFNFNVKNTIDEGKALMHKMLRQTPKYGKAASDAAQILGIFIDEEAIANLLKGDVLISVSGMQTTMAEETTFDFDEDFNITEKDTLVEKTLPIVTAFASYGSHKDIMKFVNFGLHSEVLTREGSHYRMTIPDAGMDFYLGLKKGMLVLSNSQQLFGESMAKGFPKKQRLSKKHRKLLCENASVVYWDIPNTMHEVAGESMENNIGPMAYVNMLGKQFESVSWTSSKNVDQSLNNQLDFNFVNKNVNSLDQFFNFINDIYLEFIGGAKI